MTIDGDSTQTSRSRLLAAGKALFARLGYEQASTAAIAREAGSSESQLIRYYRSKAGLLEAISDESWSALNGRIQQLVMGATSAAEALQATVDTLSEVFDADGELAFVLLFEGWRIRSKGFADFETMLRILVQRGKKDGGVHPDLPESAVVFALLGATERMARERLQAVRAGQEPPVSEGDVRVVFKALLSGLSGAPASRRPDTPASRR